MTLGLGKTKDRFRLSYVGGDTLLFLCGCPIFTQKYRAVSEQRDDSLKFMIENVLRISLHNFRRESNLAGRGFDIVPIQYSMYLRWSGQNNNRGV